VVVRAQRDSAVEELKATEEKFSAATTKVYNRYYTVFNHHTVPLLTHEDVLIAALLRLAQQCVL
jgi:hypothetical protein